VKGLAYSYNVGYTIADDDHMPWGIFVILYSLTYDVNDSHLLFILTVP